jgi:RNA polymerase sigma-70 factor (ECF subfamily)
VTRVAGARDAEDIVQATFLRVAKLASTFDRRAESARPWLIGIASRIVLERRRSFARLARALFTLGSSTPMPTSIDPARGDLARALERLSAVKRIVLILAEVEEYTCEEIALMLDIPVGTVWTRLHHARRELRAHLEVRT